MRATSPNHWFRPWLRSLFRVSLTLTALLATLAGCGGTPPKSSDNEQASAPAVTLPLSPEQTLTLPSSIHDSEFAAADTALLRFDWMSATVALANLPTDQLNTDDSDYLSYLQARIAHAQGNQARAMAELQAIDRPDLHPAIAYRVHNFERHLLDLDGDHLASAQLGLRIMEGAPTADQAALKRSIWRDLQRLQNSSITQARRTATGPDWKAWLELSEISRGDLSSLSAQLPRWLADNPGHAASSPLPGGMEFLLQNFSAPDTVALLLPLSGRLAPAGKAVRDGYLARYFQAREGSIAPQEVLVLDSDNYSSATEAYNDAVLQGAKLVVGPLSKASVSELASLPSRTAPVLALNQVEQRVIPGNSALVQLALAPEDEAQRLAELAFGTGARRALILRPAGAWGDKMEQSLGKRWQALGGSQANSISYTGRDDYSSSVKAGLGLDSSEQRNRRVRDMLATNVEFTPRRRQDMDVIFMLSRNAPEARSLKPLLAFHYAGDIPVYAPSSVYGGSPDPRDKDLDGINLVELPWLLGSNPQLKSDLAASGSDHYTRLNALGADAYLLQSRLAQLQGGPDVLIQGDTGLLSLNPQLQIQRELPLATFDGGALTPR